MLRSCRLYTEYVIVKHAFLKEELFFDIIQCDSFKCHVLLTTVVSLPAALA